MTTQPIVRRLRFASLALLIGIAASLVGCSDEASVESGEHVFEKVEAIDAAKKVEGILQNAASQQAEQSE